MIEINEGVRRPEGSSQFVPGNNLSRSEQQHFQNLERLLLQTNSQSMLAQFSSSKIDLENAKAEALGTVMHKFHAA